MKDLHRHLLLSAIMNLQSRVLNGDVFLNVLARELDLLVLALAVCTHNRPVRNRDGHAEEKDKEPVGVKAAIPDDGQPFLDEVGDAENEPGKDVVVERAIPLCEADEGGILYGRAVRHADGGRHGAQQRRTTNDDEPWWNC